MYKINACQGAIFEDLMQVFDADIVQQREENGFLNARPLRLFCRVRQSNGYSRSNIHQPHGEAANPHITIE